MIQPRWFSSHLTQIIVMRLWVIRTICPLQNIHCWQSDCWLANCSALTTNVVPFFLATVLRMVVLSWFQECWWGCWSVSWHWLTALLSLSWVYLWLHYGHFVGGWQDMPFKRSLTRLHKASGVNYYRNASIHFWLLYFSPFYAPWITRQAL